MKENKKKEKEKKCYYWNGYLLTEIKYRVREIDGQEIWERISERFCGYKTEKKGGKKMIKKDKKETKKRKRKKTREEIVHYWENGEMWEARFLVQATSKGKEIWEKIYGSERPCYCNIPFKGIN